METLEYIDAYFQQTLSAEEKQNFETKCMEDESFAGEVAFYISARQVLKEKLLEQKQQQWSPQIKADEEIPEIPPVKKMYKQKWFMYAAACVLLVLAIFFFEKTQSTQQLAINYVQDNYTHLSQEMGNQDSLQQGLSAYNSKDYHTALLIFETYAKSHPGNEDAKKYSGLGYLLTENYDKALQQFDELANIQGLRSNPGVFLKAVTLLERNNPGDKEQAKLLLKQVVDQKLEGKEKAEEWWKKL